MRDNESVDTHRLEVRRLRALLTDVYPLVEDRPATEHLQARLEREVMGPAYVSRIKRVLAAAGFVVTP